jgi:hypothetical protein
MGVGDPDGRVIRTGGNYVIEFGVSRAPKGAG